jgi:hypothetical protein
MAQRQRARAIEAFQSDPPTTVFLLSMRSGAVGINLTAARCARCLSHVLIACGCCVQALHAVMHHQIISIDGGICWDDHWILPDGILLLLLLGPAAAAGPCCCCCCCCSHVFLLEPCLNPALEEQAIGEY